MNLSRHELLPLVVLGALALAACSAFVDFGNYASVPESDAAPDAPDATPLDSPADGPLDAAISEDSGSGPHPDGSGCTGTPDFSIDAVGRVQTVVLDFSNAPRSPEFLQASTCPTPVDPTITASSRGYVVQNRTGAEATLSAWLVCASSSAALLTYYAGGTVPTTKAQISACATRVAKGAAADGYGSPDSNHSGYCPGLTKTNGGGLRLGPCEEAVVYIQDLSQQAYGASAVSPTAVRVELE